MSVKFRYFLNPKISFLEAERVLVLMPDFFCQKPGYYEVDRSTADTESGRLGNSSIRGLEWKERHASKFAGAVRPGNLRCFGHPFAAEYHGIVAAIEFGSCPPG